MEQFNQTRPPVFVVRKRKVWPWVIVSVAFVLLVGILILSLAANVVLVKGKSGRASRQITRSEFSEVLIEGKGEDKVIVIPIKGVISFADPDSIWEKESMADLVVDRLKKAEDDPTVKAVILDIDSPGGGITASDVIYHQIKQFQTSGKKVVASLGDLAASGGYYVACPADLIVAYPTTVTGNIGVIIHTFNLEGLMTKIGLKDVTIKSSEQKDILSPFRELTPEERRLIQGVVDEMYERFVDIVAEGRELEGEELETVTDGRIFTGTQAFEAGLVDRIGYRDEVIKAARELAELEEAQVVEYEKVYSLWDLFHGRARKFLTRFSPADFREMLQPSTPRLMYLWTL